jgi:hypothetical protein
VDKDLTNEKAGHGFVLLSVVHRRRSKVIGRSLSGAEQAVDLPDRASGSDGPDDFQWPIKRSPMWRSSFSTVLRSSSFPSALLIPSVNPRLLRDLRRLSAAETPALFAPFLPYDFAVCLPRSARKIRIYRFSTAGLGSRKKVFSW